MSTTSPYAGSSLERLIDLMNSVNGTNYQLGIHFTYGKISDVYPADKYNTRIKVIPVNTSVYSEQYFFYKRLPLTVLDKLPPGFVQPVVLRALPFTIHQILSDINVALGLDLTEDEVYNDSFSDIRSSYPLRIKPNGSLAWLSTPYSFSATQMLGKYRALENGGLRTLEDGRSRGLEQYF